MVHSAGVRVTGFGVLGGVPSGGMMVALRVLRGFGLRVSSFGCRGGRGRYPFGGHDSLPPRGLQGHLDLVKGLGVLEGRARAHVLGGLGSMARA